VRETAARHDIDVALGTLVEEPGGLRSAVREATGVSGTAVADEPVAPWRRHRVRERERVRQGLIPYAGTEALEAEAARHAGFTDRRRPRQAGSLAGQSGSHDGAPRAGLTGPSGAGRTVAAPSPAPAAALDCEPAPRVHSPSTAPGAHRNAC
jgi:hypothetical protein